MLNQLELRGRFERRIIIFTAFALLLLAILFGRLVDLQWLRHEGYSMRAESNRINILPVLPTRGEIFDRNGMGLAVNHVSYQVEAIPERVQDMATTIRTLATFLHWSEAKQKRLLTRIKRSRSDRPVLLDDKLKWAQVAPLAARLHRLPGVDVQAGTHRYYPYARMTSHLIGYLSLARPEDLQHGFLANELVGRAGLELQFESRLHGKPGAQREEVDALGRRVRVLERTPPKMGENLHLSLDIDLQRAASEALGGRTGAVVAMDVRTGQVLVLLSQPGFDTNRFITGLESEQWQAWLRDRRKPLLNRTIQSAYPPGSTFKPITALAGLRHHIPLATGKTDCPGYLELADRKLRCWKRSGHGHIGLHRSIVESCDVYFYELGDQLGIEDLSTEAELWGLGHRSGIDLPGESRGMIPSIGKNGLIEQARLHPNWKHRKWFRGETMIAAIGQGAVNVTPLQMARMTAAIANGGQLLKPQLERGLPAEIQRQIDVDPAWLHTVQGAMRDVVADPHGTAHASLANMPWPMAGKTGTAQVVAMSQDDQESDVPLYDRHKDHAWFIGYAPYDKPQIAIAVFVEHGGHGGSAAAPVAGAIVQALALKEQAEAKVTP